MTTKEVSPTESVALADIREPREPTTAAYRIRYAAVVAPPVADPALIGVPTFLAGSTALGLVLTEYVPATAAGASIPIILAATGIGQLVAAIWAASRDQNAVASVVGVFTGFWISYALLLLGLTKTGSASSRRMRSRRRSCSC